MEGNRAFSAEFYRWFQSLHLYIGQTGAGKTYTMFGVPDSVETEGIIYRSVRKIFAAKTEIESLSNGANKVDILAEVLEVYNEQIQDLLKRGKKQEVFLSRLIQIMNYLAQLWN